MSVSARINATVRPIVVGTIAPSIFAGSRAFCNKKKKRSSEQVKHPENERERPSGSKFQAENRPSSRRNRFFERIEISVNVTYERTIIIRFSSD